MSQRIQRINTLIKKELAQLLLKEINFPQNILVTITRVETSANLSQSKVYISTIPEGKAINVLRILQREIYSLQQKLNRMLKIRRIPKIIFLEEKETEKAGRIEAFLEKLKKEKK